MKQTFLALVFLCGLASAFISCGQPELKNVRGVVKSIEIKNDTLKTMVLSVESQDNIVTLTDARFQNGTVMQGDSVILDYIDGKENTLRGLVVTVLPKPAHYFEPSDTLITKDSEVKVDSVK